MVAGLIDEIGIVETINSKLGVDSREKITAGIMVKSYFNKWIRICIKTFYIYSSSFFDDKAIEIFIRRRCRKRLS
ncbi:DUF4277 domain-containing protein [Dulcicalothrix desertica]|uniref:DUF4277 domain-containing protein n=1 Tax=Dulcicalothrix desertica TaxID=32056 RepID=UPI003B520C87